VEGGYKTGVISFGSEEKVLKLIVENANFLRTYQGH
jgi:hypothetical protein